MEIKKYRDNTWTNIKNNWSKKEIKDARKQWDRVVSNISPSGMYRCKCGAKWKYKSFISEQKNVCSLCDDWYTPLLSNPKNKNLVLKYVDRQYHKYIFPNYDWKCDFERVLEELRQSKN